MKDTILTLIFPDGEPPEAQVKLIDTIFHMQQMKLMSYLPKEAKEVPEALEYIVIESSIARYNRVGSEGMAKESVEGHSMEFSGGDIEDYMDAIQDYLDSLEDGSDKNAKVVRFL